MLERIDYKTFNDPDGFDPAIIEPYKNLGWELVNFKVNGGKYTFVLLKLPDLTRIQREKEVKDLLDKMKDWALTPEELKELTVWMNYD